MVSRSAARTWAADSAGSCHALQVPDPANNTGILRHGARICCLERRKHPTSCPPCLDLPVYGLILFVRIPDRKPCPTPPNAGAVPAQPVRCGWSVLEVQEDGEGVLLAQAGSGRLMIAHLPQEVGSASPVFLLGSHSGARPRGVGEGPPAQSGGTKTRAQALHVVPQGHP